MFTEEQKIRAIELCSKNLAEAFGYYNEWHLHSALGYPRHGNICGSRTSNELMITGA